MRCLRRIANIKWQDMIPNTEVLQRCAQNGIEHHITRAQLRWYGHLVRMADDRIHNTVFYGELDAGHRTRGGQQKRYKDVLKATLKSCGIPHNNWEATFGVVPAILVYETTKRRGAMPWEIREWDGRLSSLHQTLTHLCVMSTADSAHCGSACIATTEHMPIPTLTEVEIRRTDGSLHTCPLAIRPNPSCFHRKS